MQNIIFISVSMVMSLSLITVQVQANDSHRDSSDFLDAGFYWIYRLTPAEVDKLEPKHVKQILEGYARRYFALYMFFSRDIVSIEVSPDYPASLMNPVIDKMLSASDNDLRARLRRLYVDEEGVTNENKALFAEVYPLVDRYDKEKFGASRGLKLPPMYSPNAIYLGYLKKFGLRQSDYQPPFPTISSSMPLPKEDGFNMRSLFLAALVGICFFALGFMTAKMKKESNK